MEPESNSNRGVIFSVIAALSGAIIAGSLTIAQPDNTGFEVVRNAFIGAGLAPILMYATATVIQIFGKRK
jgi:hypothetical protein